MRVSKSSQKTLSPSIISIKNGILKKHEFFLLLVNFIFNPAKDIPIPPKHVCSKFGDFIFKLKSHGANKIGVLSVLDYLPTRRVCEPYVLKKKRST